MRLTKLREIASADASDVYLFCLRRGNEVDPELSVYEIEPSEFPSMVLEHYAAPGNNPPDSASGVHGIDLSGCGIPVQNAPYSTGFSLYDGRHRYLPLGDESQAMALAGWIAAEFRSGRQILSCSKPELRRRLADIREQEHWRKFLDANPRWAKFARI